MNTENTDRNNEHETPNTSILGRKPTVEIDIDYYQSVIDDPSVTEARKRELIEVIGRIVMPFIDIGFGVHPVQLARETKAGGTGKAERPAHTNQTEKETEETGL